MSRVYKDRVLETSTTTGTGSYTLAGAVAGHQDFSVIGNGNTVMYCAYSVDALGNPNGGWEVGEGTWSTGGTLARTTILASTNANAAVDWTAGTRRIACVAPAAKVSLPNVQVFTADGTWNKPAGCAEHMVICQGAGAGGGSGRKGASNAARAGGGGGGGGGWTMAIYPDSLLGSTESVTVGVGGPGGAAQTTNSTDGISGTNGEDTVFGSYVTAFGGIGGSGGTAGSGATGYGKSGCIVPGGDGGLSSPNAAGGTPTPPNILGYVTVSQTTWAGARAGGGGGGGSGISAAGTVQNAGGGGNRSTLWNNTGGGAAGTAGGNGGNGGSVTANMPYGGAGGGGGGAAGTDSVGNSGAGGNGADGICVVISW